MVVSYRLSVVSKKAVSGQQSTIGKSRDRKIAPTEDQCFAHLIIFLTMAYMCV